MNIGSDANPHLTENHIALLFYFENKKTGLHRIRIDFIASCVILFSHPPGVRFANNSTREFKITEPHIFYVLPFIASTIFEMTMDSDKLSIRWFECQNKMILSFY